MSIERGHPVLFDDHKSADAMRTIGEVAAALGLKTHILRYWEEQFANLRPLKRSGGRRLYRPEDVALIALIDRLVNREGYTLKGAQQAIDAGGGKIASQPEPNLDSAQLLQGLRQIRGRLAAALGSVSG